MSQPDDPTPENAPGAPAIPEKIARLQKQVGEAAKTLIDQANVAALTRYRHETLLREDRAGGRQEIPEAMFEAASARRTAEADAREALNAFVLKNIDLLREMGA